MPRSGRLRNYIKEVAESPRIEKLSFIPPFLVLIVELILLQHAISIQVLYVIELTLVLIALSIIEIIFVAEEIHDHYKRTIFDRILTIRLDDFITERREKNVKHLVEEFIETYPKYSHHRSGIYHIACQIMETHKEEAWEKILKEKLNKFIKRRKKMTVDEITRAFIQKNPAYKKHPGKVYIMASQILGSRNNNKSK
jgi:hypothetical protein